MAKRVEYGYYHGNNDRFINPYNFVPVTFASQKYKDAKKDSEAERKADGVRFTGVLKCELITKTPVAVPDTAAPYVFDTNGNLIASADSAESFHLDQNKKYHYGYHFMRDIEGHPMIPASSLRGTVRSVYEAATDSCFSTSDEKQEITFRAKNAFKPGLLHKNKSGEYELYEAERYIFIVPVKGYAPYSHVGAYRIRNDIFSLLFYGQHMWFLPLLKGGRPEEYRKNGYVVGKLVHNIHPNIKPGWDDGYICIGEPFSKKHFESIFKKGKRISLSGFGDQLEKAAIGLEKIIEIYNDKSVNRNAGKGKRFYQKRNYKNIGPDKFLPVWYEIDRSRHIIHLSVASIGRSAYQKTMGDMLGDHTRCKDRKMACPSCRLFGMIGENSLGSRIRFSDAVMGDIVPLPRIDQFVHLKELAGPKPSYLPFYLKNSTPGVIESWSYESGNVTLSGRKFYWHNAQKNAYSEQNPAKQFGERNASMELIGENNEHRFFFDVYYDGLTERELKQLKWVLTLGENDKDSKLCYKIGHGKPIGLGSAKILINNGWQREFLTESYAVKPIDPKPDSLSDILAGGSDFDKKAIEVLRIITNVGACRLPVTYPGIVDQNGKIYNDSTNDHASHKWFSENYSFGKRPKQVLPDIGKQNDRNQALQYMEVK